LRTFLSLLDSTFAKVRDAYPNKTKNKLFSFPRAAWQCSLDALASRNGTLARPHWVPTQRMGTRKKRRVTLR